jgi:hypothetical protein
MRVAAQDGGKQVPAAAADVDDGADIGEVVARRHRRRKRRGPLEHRGVEDGGVLGMLRQELKKGHAVGGVESGLAGPDRVQDVLKWLAAAKVLCIRARDRIEAAAPDRSRSPRMVRPNDPGGASLNTPRAASRRRRRYSEPSCAPASPASSAQLTGPSAKRSGMPSSVTA